MSGSSTLHEFDQRLCNYAVENVAQHLPTLFTDQGVPVKEKPTDDRPRFMARLSSRLGNGPLFGYIQGHDEVGEEDGQVRLLLNDEELFRLELALEEEDHRHWDPDKELHERYITTIKEVRDCLSPQAAEDWSRVCAEHARKLEEDRVRLSEGIAVIRAWVRRLRTLLRVIGAVELLPCPEGRSPTPTHPTPAAPVSGKQPTDQAIPPVAVGMSSIEAVPGLAATLRQLTETLNNISAPASTQAPPAEAVSKEDAAKFLGVPVKTVEYLIRTRKVRYVQLGSQRGRVIPVEALRKLLQENTQLTAEEELRQRGRR
jgi:hypothetical protein